MKSVGRRLRRQTIAGRAGPGAFVQEAELVTFDRALVTRLGFENARITDWYTEASRFEGCDFRGARLLGGTLGPSRPTQSVYVDCNFEGVDLRHVSAENSRFERCSFRHAQLDGWTPDFAEFVGCAFAGRIFGARFSGAPHWKPGLIGRASNDFLDNDFREAELVQSSFEWGVDISRQRLPVGPQYLRLDRLSERLEAARGAILAWPDQEDRKEGEFLLKLCGRPGLAAQAEVFIGREHLGSPTSAEDRFWAAVLGSPPPGAATS